METIFWEREYSKESAAGKRGIEATRISLRWNEQYGIWQRIFYICIHKEWYPADREEIEGITLQYLNDHIDSAIQSGLVGKAA